MKSETLRNIKDRLKKIRDQFESKPIETKKSIGGSSYWTLDTQHLDQDSVVLSGGVGKDISFELDLIELIGCKIYLFDPSPTGIDTINSYKTLPKNLIFIPKGLGKNTGVAKFSFPENQNEGSFTIERIDKKKHTAFPITSVSEFCKQEKIKKIDCLKLDIEGFEYEVLDDVLSNPSITITQILVEFHHFFDDIPKYLTKGAMKKLKKAGYKKIHRNEVDYSFVLS